MVGLYGDDMKPNERFARRAPWFAIALATLATRLATAQPAAATAAAPAAHPHEQSRHESPQQPSADPGGHVVDAQTPLRAGQPVAIEWHGSWYAGRVVSLLSTQDVRVHYDGYDASADENVPRARLRLGATISRPHPGPVEPVGIPVTPTTMLTPGLAVHVVWHGQWWAARVVAVLADGQVVIRYDGYDASADEIVTRDRLLIATPNAHPATNATPQPGRIVDAQTPLAAGDAVHIEWQGAFYPGRVITVLEGGQVRVHYLGYGSESDENVPRTRLRIGSTSRMIIQAHPTGQ